MIKRIIIAAAAVSMLMCGCAKKQENVQSQIEGDAPTSAPWSPKAVEEREQEKTEEAEKNGYTPAPTDAASTLAPFEESETAVSLTPADMPSQMSKADFESMAVEDGYIKYISGDDKWGIILPPGTEIGDEAETGVMFLYKSSLINVIVADGADRIETPQQAKELYSIFGEVKVGNFAVISENGQYQGCRFDYTTPENMRGFVKYAVKGAAAAIVSGANYDSTQETSDALSRCVDTVVIF